MGTPSNKPKPKRRRAGGQHAQELKNQGGQLTPEKLLYRAIFIFKRGSASAGMTDTLKGGCLGGQLSPVYPLAPFEPK